MPETPEREIEKQLRQHAEARRNAAGDASLHPATRRGLQAEVRQQWGGAGGQRPDNPWLARLWPRFALAFGLLAMMVTAAVLLLGPDQKNHTDFAKLEDKAQLNTATALPATAPVMAAVSMNTAEPATSESQREEERVSRHVAESIAQNPTAFADGQSAKFKNAKPAAEGAATSLALGAAAPGGEVKNFTTSDSSVPPDSISGLSSADGKDVPSAPSKFMKSDAGRELKLTQTFRNAGAAKGESAKQSVAPPVLMNFTVAQNGNQLTVVDADGSVYRGTVEPVAFASADQPKETNTFARRNDLSTAGEAGGKARATFELMERDRVAARAATAAPPLNIAMDAAVIVPAAEMQNWQFKVEGTNRSLRQRVIFTGNLMQNASANNIFIGNQSGTTNRQTYQQQPAAQNQFNYSNHALPPNNAINGRVQLGDRKATELNALSVDP